jgi:threonine synthase
MVSVQAAGCAPIVRAFEARAARAEPVHDPTTVASGLKVPSAIGDFLILSAIRSSSGTAVGVGDDALLDGARRLAREEGIFASPEAGATVAALPLLLEAGIVQPEDAIVCFVTGHGIKYPVLCGGASGRVS